MRLNLGLFALLAMALGCVDGGFGADGSSTVDGFPGPAASADGAAVVAVAEPSPATAGTWIESRGFVVHEWGTFTSVQSSVGTTMTGMHRVDEPLPQFVYSLSNGPFKGLPQPPEGVTQRLETPVLYFYTAEPREVTVDVGFPEGVVSEYYPNVASVWPEPSPDGFAIGNGSARWQVRLQPGLVDVPYVDPEDIWAPSRNVPEAASVLTDNESERFIFYRGLGTFEMPVRVLHASLDRIAVTNESDVDVPFVFLIRVHEGGAGIEALGALPAGGRIDEVPSPKELDVDAYIEDAQAAVAAALETTGLYPDEARAMVETWERSYFRTPGIRLLYVAPREWTDALLPIALDPVPDELVRTMIGRIEVMTEDEEATLVGEIEALAPNVAEGFDEAYALLDGLGRLAEPKLRRIAELVDTVEARELCDMLIDYVRWQP